MVTRRPNRSANAVLFVYCSKGQRAALARAAEKTIRGVPGSRLPLSTFVLNAGLKEARRLNVEVDSDEDHDHIVPTPQGTFGLDDIAPRASRMARWEVRERGPVIGSLDIDVHGEVVDPRDPLLTRVANAFVRQVGAKAIAQRPRYAE